MTGSIIHNRGPCPHVMELSGVAQTLHWWKKLVINMYTACSSKQLHTGYRSIYVQKEK